MYTCCNKKNITFLDASKSYGSYVEENIIRYVKYFKIKLGGNEMLP
jgi:hypothetical protein